MRRENSHRCLPLNREEQLNLARTVLQAESRALLAIAERLGDEFCQAVQLVRRCRGSVIVTGMGKAGLIGQKIAATLASTGTRSHFVHPAEAVHGDLGRIDATDVLVILSKSGRTEEIVRLLPSLNQMGIPGIAITADSASPVATAAVVTLALGPVDEACTLGLAPTTSSTAMLALGDALAVVASRMRAFSAEDFGRLHPAGSLGRKLSRVEDIMRPLGQCRVASEDQTVRDIYVGASHNSRRVGAILVVDAGGRLSGIFTDSDLARLLERRRDHAFDAPIAHVMTPSPTMVPAGTRATAAIRTMSRRSISELPVVSSAGRPVGLIDITDVVGLFPQAEPAATGDSAAVPAPTGKAA
jgi:arabinose-5-phosphate isomerase